MKLLDGLYYSKDHEWLKIEGDRAYVGITDFAQHQLGDVVFVELPEVDETYDANETFGTIESVKAASDILAPVTFTVLEVNEDLEDSPELINEDPYNNYIAIVSIEDESELEELLSKEEYEEFIK